MAKEAPKVAAPSPTVSGHSMAAPMESPPSPPPPPPVESSEDSVAPNYGDGKPPEWLWIDEGKNEVTAEIYAYKDPESGKLRAVTIEPVEALRVLKLIEYPISSQWTIPTKPQMDNYRDRAQIVDRTIMRTMIDRTQVQEEVLRHHLLSLKIHLPASEGTEPQLIQLQRDKKGRLTEQTVEQIKKMHPTVFDLLMQKFTTEASIIL